MKEYNQTFLEAFEILMVHEGREYTCDPNDMGGETKFGISKRAYPHLDIKNLTEEKAQHIFYSDYWEIAKCYLIAEKTVAIKFFDIAVNVGVKKAILLIQRAVRACDILVARDGLIGPQTLHAIHHAGVDQLLAAFRSETAAYYRMIVLTDKTHTQHEYLEGWLNRAYD